MPDFQMGRANASNMSMFSLHLRNRVPRDDVGMTTRFLQLNRFIQQSTRR